MTTEQRTRLAPACRGILDSLLGRCPGLLWASVSTRDGFEVASAGDKAHEALSVMSGTMHALADGMAAEASLGACHDIILSSEGGRIAILSARDSADGLVLAGMGEPGMTLGMLLSCCAAACAELAKAQSAAPGHAPA